MGETRVDLQHLLEDLRDAYSGPIEQTILTEIVANALDSGARRIHVRTSAADAAITVIDDGRGMKRREPARYHDVAASTKPRGDGVAPQIEASRAVEVDPAAGPDRRARHRRAARARQSRRISCSG